MGIKEFGTPKMLKRVMFWFPRCIRPVYPLGSFLIQLLINQKKKKDVKEGNRVAQLVWPWVCSPMVISLSLLRATGGLPDC